MADVQNDAGLCYINVTRFRKLRGSEYMQLNCCQPPNIHYYRFHIFHCLSCAKVMIGDKRNRLEIILCGLSVDLLPIHFPFDDAQVIMAGCW